MEAQTLLYPDRSNILYLGALSWEVFLDTQDVFGIRSTDDSPTEMILMIVWFQSSMFSPGAVGGMVDLGLAVVKLISGKIAMSDHELSTSQNLQIT